MPRYTINPHCLIDRPWRSGHPFRPHRGRCRRIVMSSLFVLLAIVITGYAYLTDASRVRVMARAYLSSLLGGRVEVGSVTLSIFEGLRVDDVAVYVDPDGNKPDALLFSAQAFVVTYDPRKWITGQLEATEIVAQKPHVYLTLTQTARGDQWNYMRLRKIQPPQPPGHLGAPTKFALPQLLLRNAIVEISEVHDGRRNRVGSMNIDGQLSPVGDGERYQFQMQSRGVSQGLGPYASGIVAVNTAELTAHLRNVEFSNDIRSMFPANLRDWWARHELSGRIESVDLSYAPAREQDHIPAKFSVQTILNGVTLAVRRDEWSSHEELAQWKRLQDAISLMQQPYRLAGYKTPEPEASASLRHEISAACPAQVLAELADAAPLRLREVSGTFVFNPQRIDVNDLLVRVGTGDPDNPAASNAFRVNGSLDGYSPDAPLHLHLNTVDKGGAYFPSKPTFIDSLPRDARILYNDLKPQGTCRIDANVDREKAGGRPRVGAKVDIVEAKILFREFPYPFHGIKGTLVFGRDSSDGNDYLNVLDVHAAGITGGPNEHCRLIVSGRVGPLGPENPEPGIDLRATGEEVSSEAALLSAMPRDVHNAFKLFDEPGKGEFPKFKGNFVSHIYRELGPRKRIGFDMEVDILDGSGRVVGFPYPLQHVKGNLSVREGYVDVHNVGLTDGKMSARATGRVRWGDPNGRDEPLKMDLNISAQNVPVNDNLLLALPAGPRSWIARLGIAGNLDCDGKVFTTVPKDWEKHVEPGHKPKDPPPQFDLAIGIHEGTLWPADGLFSVSSVAGKLHLTNDRLDVLEVHGRREGAEIAATAGLPLTGPASAMTIHVTAKNLSMDRPLYSLLPPEARKSWDEVRPEGTVDADIDYRGPVGSPAPSAVASASPQIELPATDDRAFVAVIRPRDLSVKVRTVPYPLNFTGGSVTVSPGKAVLKDLAGTHGKAKFIVSGDGVLSTNPSWDLSLHADNIPADDELRKAMPPMIRDIVDGTKLRGTIGIDFTRLLYRGSASTAGDPDIDVEGTITLKNGGMEVGIPLADIRGGMKFKVATRQGKFDGLAGAVTADSLTLGGRPVRDLHVDLLRAPGRSDLRLDKLRAKVAGELAGNVLLTMPDQGANRYSMNLVVRNADVRDLTGETDKEMRGELTASLSLEGKWDDPAARRGRGDVLVAGKQLYRIPLMLGLLKVTNLSLPIGQPFTRGSARYTVEGSRVNFEQMDLRADNMSMNGTGYLDFGTKQVRLTLTTDNPTGFKIPFISDLWQGARQELLRINVEGTVQDPKVQTSSMGVITTTIDQVFKGDAPKK
jgi:hypothetical protein